jgi:glycosyltransferase involved in cell wall biosynthesis
MRKLLVVDSHYSFEAIRNRGLEDSITCRDLGGFFEKVWSVHPFGTIVTSEEWTSRCGRPQYYKLNSFHTFMEGKVGRFSFLEWWPSLNFLFSQIDTIVILFRLIRKERISVIRADEPQYNGLFGWVLSRLCGIPLLLRVGNNHDKDYEVTGRISMPRLFKTRRIEKFFEQFVLSRADCIAAASQEYRNYAIANGAKPEAATLFRYGNLVAKQHFIDPSHRSSGQKLLSELGVDSNRFLLTIARLEKKKHPDDVVRVLADIRRRGFDFKLILAGEGHLRNRLVELANELGVRNQVILCGNKNQEWLSRVIPLAAVVVSPLTGRALTESALGAAPIVAYDLDWHGELIETGVTGELVPHLDWKKMADAVEHFLTDSEYASRVGQAVRKRVLEMMDPLVLDQHERDIYDYLINGFKKPNPVR